MEDEGEGEGKERGKRRNKEGEWGRQPPLFDSGLRRWALSPLFVIVSVFKRGCGPCHAN
jgi:hypothetical protein